MTASLHPAEPDSSDDVRRLHEMGYSQELARRLGTFSNFALSFSIICILAGGVTSFHLGFCSVGGASIGLGWPLVVLFALAVAATMGQLASAFPTAGGLYHWAVTSGWPRVGLGHRLASTLPGSSRCSPRSTSELIASQWDHCFPGACQASFDLPAQALGVVLITATQAMINHLGIGVTARLTDFSGYWILLITAVLTASLLAFAPGLDLSRLITFENFSGTAGGNVWPADPRHGVALCPGTALARIYHHRFRRLGPCR